MTILRPLLLSCLAVLCAALAGPAAAESVRLVEQRESLYNNIYVHQRGNEYIMSFGRNRRYWTESRYDADDELLLPVIYTRYMTAALAYLDEVGSIAEIGFGGGRTVWYLHRYLPDVPIVSVELDPEVVELAKKYFGVREEPQFTIRVKDGRLFLRGSDEVFDVILIDAYRGPFVPFHLTTTEFYAMARDRLSADGVLVQNIEPSTMLFEAALVTLKAVFEHVDLYSAGGNVVAIAYDGAPRAQEVLAGRARSLQAAHGFRHPLPELIGERRIVSSLPDREPLTDDFAPVQTLKAVERHNADIDAWVKRPQ